MTDQVVTALEKYLRPLGAVCVIEAQHMCMDCRGVNKQGAVTTTSRLTGVFKTDPAARAEVFQLIRG